MRRAWRFSDLLMLLTIGTCGCAGHATPVGSDPAPFPQSLPAAATDDGNAVETEAGAWKAIAGVLRPGTLHDGIYTVVIPRDDLDVTVEGMVVPTAAGIESRFNFYHCSCGKTSVLGEFVVTDYEADDVIGTLLDKQFTVASLAPFLLHERPRLLSIHFHGEGKSGDIAAVLKQALSYTGKQRDAPATNIGQPR